MVAQEATSLAAEPEEKVGLRPSSIYRPSGSSGQQALACLSGHESRGEAGIIIPGLEEIE